MIIPRCFAILIGAAVLGACGGGGEHAGSAGASNNAGAGAGGAPSTGGKPSGGGTPTIGGSSLGGSSLGGGAQGGSANGGSSGTLDMTRVLTARKISRRFSLGDRDHDVCVARAEGGIQCTIAAVQTALVDKKVDLVTMSGLGYCAILDDKSVKCEFATSDTQVAKDFGASVTTAAYLLKEGQGLIAIDAAGGVRIGDGAQELKATTAPGSVLGGPDFDVCALHPDGLVGCFPLIAGNTFDKSEFDLANTRYVSIAQSLSLFAGIDQQGSLRVRHELQSKTKAYENETFVQVAAYSDYWCMLTNSGTLRCDGYDIAQAPAGITDVPTGEFLAVDVNEEFACAVRPTGELVCWGGSAPAVADKVRLD